jgi:hypothetical protein
MRDCGDAAFASGVGYGFHLLFTSADLNAGRIAKEPPDAF